MQDKRPAQPPSAATSSKGGCAFNISLSGPAHLLVLPCGRLTTAFARRSWSAAVQLTWIACSDSKVVDAVSSCWAGWHLPTAVLNIVLLPLYVWISLILSLAFVDHSLEAPTAGAKLHGRGDAGVFVCQLAVIIGKSLVAGSDASSLWIRLVLMAVLAVVWVNAYVFWQPHVSGKMNDLRAGLGGSFAWTVFCVFCKLTWPATPAATLLLVGLLPIGLLVALMARLRRMTIEGTPIDKLQGVPDIHRWALRRIKSAVKLTEKRMEPDLRVAHVGLHLLNSVPAGGEQMHESSPNHRSTNHSSITMGTSPETPAGLLRLQSSGHSPKLSGLFSSAKVHPAQNTAALSVASEIAKPVTSAASKRLTTMHALTTDASLFAAGSLSGGQQHAATHLILRDLLLSQAEAALQSATNQTSNGTLAFAHFIEALFQRVFRNSRYTEFAALRAAKASSPGFDVAFFVYQRHRQLNEAKANSNSSGEASLSAIDRLLYEQHSQDAADAGLEWNIGQARLWSALAHKTPSIDTLHTHTVYLAAALVKADEAYNAMRRLNPNSSALLRAVGVYLSSMQGDFEAGEQLTAQADRMEQVAMQRSQQLVPQFVFGEAAAAVGAVVGETSAHLTVSGSQHSLGSIVEANTVASRLLGFSKQALLAKRMSDVFPLYLAEAFDASLFEYTTSGRGLDIDDARLHLVVHSGGHLIPVAMHIGEAPSVEDSDAVNFYIQLQLLKLPHEFALVDAEADLLPIVGFSSGASMMTELSDIDEGYNAGRVPAVTSSETSLLRFVPEIDEVRAGAAFGSSVLAAATNQLASVQAAAEATAEDSRADEFGESLIQQQPGTTCTTSFDEPKSSVVVNTATGTGQSAYKTMEAWVFDLKLASKATRYARKQHDRRLPTTFAGFKSCIRLEPVVFGGLRRQLLLVSWAEQPVLQVDMSHGTKSWGTAMAVALASSKLKKALQKKWKVL